MATRKATQIEDALGNLYDVKDAEAREDITELKSAISAVDEEINNAAIWEDTQNASYTVVDGSYVASVSRYYASASGYHRTAPIPVPDGYNLVVVGYTYSNSYVETLYFSTREDIPSAVSSTKITSVTSGTEYEIPEGTKTIFLSSASNVDFGTLTFVARHTAKEKINDLEPRMESAEDDITLLIADDTKTLASIGYSEDALENTGWTVGYVKTDGSGISASAGWQYSSFIDVSDSFEIVPNFTYANNYISVIAFFADESISTKTFLGKENAAEGTPISVPPAAKFCILSVSDALASTAAVVGKKTTIKSLSAANYNQELYTNALKNFITVLDTAEYLYAKSINGNTGEISSAAIYSSFIVNISQIDRSIIKSLIVDVQRYGNNYEGCAFYKYVNSVRTYISGKSAVETGKVETYVIDIPDDAEEFGFCFVDRSVPAGFTLQNPKIQMYIPKYIDSLMKKVESIDPGLDVNISFPNQYDAVVGDKLELFYSGILECKNPNDFYVELDCSQAKGRTYNRQWEYTPASGDTDFTMKLLLYRTDGEKLKEKSTLINVVQKPSSVSAMNVCCVGDSLTVNGVWCAELKRRLTGSGGTPAGDGYSNISFVGTMGTDTKYEGRGGWTWGSYCSSGEVMYWVDVVSGQKTDAMHESVWSDGTNEWILETIQESKLKFKRAVASGTYTMPSSGTLTYVSGGGSETGAITYNNATAESGNPFYNPTANKLDFARYCSNLGISGIDTMIILLGWNNVLNGGVDANITNGKTFVDALHSEYPNCKVVVCGLQVPSIDGWATNYGTYKSGNWTKDYLTIKHCMFQLNDAYQEWCNESGYSSFMNFVQLSGQFDMEYGYPTTSIPVNQRSSEMMAVQTNCVHPSSVGQNMIADAVYRKMISLLV